MSNACNYGKNIHFGVNFYSDAEEKNLVFSMRTEQYWQYFTVNGIPMTAEGFFFCQCDCGTIEFTLPLNSPPELDVLYNTQLYAKLVDPAIYFRPGGFANINPKAQIIFVIDESESMVNEHAWIAPVVRQLEAGLLAKGVGPNDYGFVGFASDIGSPRSATYNVSGHPYPFMNAETFAEFIEQGGLVAIGGPVADGYQAMKYAWNEFNGALQLTNAVNMVLITDDGRTALDSTTAADVEVFINQWHAKVNTITRCGLKASNGVQAIALSSDGTAYVSDPISGGYTIVKGGSAIPSQCFGDAVSTLDTYIEPTLNVWGGVVWDIDSLKYGGQPAQVFTDIFVAVQSQELSQTFACVLDNKQTAHPFYCKRGEQNPAFHVNLNAAPNGCAHIRITFYADSARTQVVTSAFSFDDQKRFYIDNDNNPPCPITPHGVRISSKKIISITYTPEVISPDEPSIGGQPTHYNPHDGTSPDSIVEVPLVCGTTYYVTVDLHYADTNSFIHYGDYEYTVPCSAVDLSVWRSNSDAQNWLSSGQGKQDMRISKTINQSLFPSVGANLTGQFLIAWQDFRNSDPTNSILSEKSQIYYGVWDMTDDVIWSSGQGNFDGRLFPYGFRPVVTLDSGGVFYTAARKDNGITSFAGPVVTSTSPTLPTYFLTDEQFVNLDDGQHGLNQYMEVRVYEPDATGSFVVDKSNVVSVVEDCIVRFDVMGVSGAYAIRLRNEIYSDFSDWIHIDQKRLDKVAGVNDVPTKNEDSLLAAYLIDDKRIIVPWVLSPGTGMKKVTMQILTFYGITPAFSLNVMSNVQEMQYDLSLYNTYASGVFSNPVPYYKGYPVVTFNKDSNGNALPVYVRVEFADKTKLALYLNKISTLNKHSDLSNALTFNVLQQGINDQYGLNLTLISEGIYVGQMEIVKSDGVFNQDGLSAIVVNIPNPCMKMQNIPCGVDNLDPYNKMNLSILRDFYVKYDENFSNMTPQNLAAAYRQSGLANIITSRPMREFYNVDDPRFMFGNPKFFVNLGK